MMHSQDEDMRPHTQAQESGAYKRTCRQVEWQVGFLGCQRQGDALPLVR